MKAVSTLVCLWMSFFSTQVAHAFLSFECGTYDIHAHLVFGSLPAKSGPIPISQKSQKKTHSPAHLLWSLGSVSELVLPVELSPLTLKKLDAFETHPVLGRFRIRVKQAGRDPKGTEVIDFGPVEGVQKIDSLEGVKKISSSLCTDQK
jgi:hypothetical protein